MLDVGLSDLGDVRVVGSFARPAQCILYVSQRKNGIGRIFPCIGAGWLGGQTSRYLSVISEIA